MVKLLTLETECHCWTALWHAACSASQSFNINSSWVATFWTPGSRLGGKKRFVGMKMLKKLQVLMTLPATLSYSTAVKNLSKHLYAIMHSCKYLLLKDMVLSWTWKAYNIFIDHHICWAKRALIRHEVVACGVVTPIEAGPTPRPIVGAAVALAPRDSHTPSSSAQTHLGTRQTSGDAANVSSTELPAGRTLVGLSLETKFGVGVWFLATLFGEQDILNLRLQLYCLLCS